MYTQEMCHLYRTLLEDITKKSVAGVVEDELKAALMMVESLAEAEQQRRAAGGEAKGPAWDELGKALHGIKVLLLEQDKKATAELLSVANLVDGEGVTLVGLQSRPELNGTRGIVKGANPITGRIRIFLSFSTKTIEVKSANLVAVNKTGSFSVDEVEEGDDFRGSGLGAKSSPALAAEEAYKATKARNAHRAAIEVCMQCGVGGANLKKCGGCDEVSFCGKSCQTKAWPKHKTRCRLMRFDHYISNLSPPEREKPRHAFGSFPKVTIALPASLTGYKGKEVPITMPLWTFEEENPSIDPANFIGSLEKETDGRSIRASVVSCIKTFFKEERAGGAQFTEATIGNLCTDALLAYKLGIDGVRECTGEFLGSCTEQRTVQLRMTQEQAHKFFAKRCSSSFELVVDKWGPKFSNVAPVPPDWDLDMRLKSYSLLLGPSAGLKPETLESWRRGIALVRAEIPWIEPKPLTKKAATPNEPCPRSKGKKYKKCCGKLP
jgi:hypothetical protein